MFYSVLIIEYQKQENIIFNPQNEQNTLLIRAVKYFVVLLRD